MVSAGDISWVNRARLKCGRCGAGNVLGIVPKREPMVVTGRCRNWTSAVVTRMAISVPGTRWVMRGHI